jgi:UDP-N-acetylglucosamine 2-epimerase (non-hydrolysing)
MLSDIKNIHLIEPLEYDEFIYAMSKCYFILTDSGGVQEEAPSLGKPVLVMRDTTERPEGIEAGTVKLVGTDFRQIVNECEQLITNDGYYGRMSKAENPYGDGKAVERIVSFLAQKRSSICM